MAMTQLECFRKTVAHEPHEAYLFHASCTPDLKRRLAEHLGVPEDANPFARFGAFGAAGLSPKPPEGWTPPDYSVYFKDYDAPEGSYIDRNGCLHEPGSLYHFTHFVSPLRNAESFEEIESYPYPSVKGFENDHLKGEVEKAHAAGRVVSAAIGHMFETAWQIRGIEPFLMDMAMRPEWCEHILDRLFERNLDIAVACAEAGVDFLRTGDDVATQTAMMFSPDQWYHFLGSRWEKVYRAARDIKPDIEVWYHSDGNINAIIPRLIEIGVTILNPVQPECLDLVALKKEFGDRLVFDGAIGTQTTMPFGTADDVRACVRERVETLGRDGALILSPTHTLEPEVPIENIMAFVETCLSYGRLD